ncbi:two-component sensor histidine kinase [Stutzerimonas sp. VN223-3]|uniref:sensor histidine kinase n=1 Tax=Stutzerimonas sp. VN223-3 TaxID=3384601 RepID=UPI0038B5CF7D
MRSFEDDPTLADLLPDERQQQLLQLVQVLADRPIALSETPLAGAEAVEFNLETLGWLHCPEDIQVQQAGARLLEFVLFYVGKYRLAANLHHDSTEASFAELQRQHAALQESEARYKSLSEQLQTRVEEQVQIIEKAQQQLYETARLRSIGQLAAGVAHEINNPIGFIASNLRVAGDYLDELEQQLPTDQHTRFLIEDFRALLQESTSGTRRIAAIVADLKTFSNIDQADFVPCDLNALLGTTCHLLQAEGNQTLDIQLSLGELPRLAGYPAKLSQAFYNVLDNAAKSLREDGRILISTHQDEYGALEVIIEDNGCGIADSDLPRVFDPFFTTRPVGSGTGLGLTVARDILVAHQGEILLSSHQDTGTRVTLRFLCR